MEAGFFSEQAKVIWAKKGNGEEPEWLPLFMHLDDTVAVMEFLWRCWVAKGTKRSLCEHMHCDEDAAGQLLVFLAASHDLGKATPCFQSQKSWLPGQTDIDCLVSEQLLRMGVPIKASESFHSKSTPHALASEEILDAFVEEYEGEDAVIGFHAISAILGAHHGMTPSKQDYCLNQPDSRMENYYLNTKQKLVWKPIQEEFIRYAFSRAGFRSVCEMPIPDMEGQVLSSALLIMADWIASNEEVFPLVRIGEPTQENSGFQRCGNAEERGDFKFLETEWIADEHWQTKEFFQSRFSFQPNSLQREVCSIATDVPSPGITVIEAQMGIGKTEAALAAAEIFSSRFGMKGVFFALPTQATSDGMFGRVEKWIESLNKDNKGDVTHSITLVHGKAQFNRDYQKIPHYGPEESTYDVYDDDSPSAIAVYDWFTTRKRSLLSDFVVGTIDQLLFAALQQKHVMLRHLGLAGKVVVVDECHAYDAYMNVYLGMALRWLGAYHIPVILLSATLPSEKKSDLINAYLGSEKYAQVTIPPVVGYPAITYSEGKDIRCKAVGDSGGEKQVRIARIRDDGILDILRDKLAGGGCAGIIFNTVGHAQDFAKLALERYGNDEVCIIHSRFVTTDRLRIEEELRKELGKPSAGNKRPHRLIVVGTQVLEQSLDVDFDVMISELCPMDLLLQRIGRLHRHQRSRPCGLETATCYVVFPSEGKKNPSEYVYEPYLLDKTAQCLPDIIRIPCDIPNLVRKVYDDVSTDTEFLRDERKEMDGRRCLEERKAEKFRLNPPSKDLFFDWLSTSVSDNDDVKAQATVRDTDPSIEVIAIQRKQGKLFLLSDGSEIPAAIDEKQGMRIARESLRLPPVLCEGSLGNDVIQQLEKKDFSSLSGWNDVQWLRGSLVLIFDDAGNAEFSVSRNGGAETYHLHYDKTMGLTCRKEG